MASWTLYPQMYALHRGLEPTAAWNPPRPGTHRAAVEGCHQHVASITATSTQPATSTRPLSPSRACMPRVLQAVTRSMQRLALFAHLPPIRKHLPERPRKPFERIHPMPDPPPRSARPIPSGGA